MKKGIALFLSLVLLFFAAACGGTEPVEAAAETTEPPPSGFLDVEPGAWYAEAIHYVGLRGMMFGVGGGFFRPEDAVNRAQAAALLYRVARNPQICGNGTFSDVPSGAWFEAAALWTAENGVIAPAGEGRFDPAGTLTQGELVTMLWRLTVPAEDAAEGEAAALAWAAETGVTAAVSGADAGGFAFSPDAPADRAVAALFVSRFLEWAGRPRTVYRVLVSAPEDVPEEYTLPSAKPGRLENFYYDTWESFTYDSHSLPLRKHAVVYLPYGYPEAGEYDVFYFMHGGSSDENTTLGTPEESAALKHILDHAIENGELPPLIVVCPTYNNTNELGMDSERFKLSMELTENYHRELVNDLIPAVEGTYAVYAGGTDPETLAAARDHRGFGGFSNGGVATWRSFEYALDYFRYFLPLSCGTELDDETIWSAAEGRDLRDYFVWMFTGSLDFALPHDTPRAERARASGYFTEGVNFSYQVMDGYKHEVLHANAYVYNALRGFFGTNARRGVLFSPREALE